MAVLTLVVDDRNITESQFEQALTIVKTYGKERKNKAKLIEAKAKELYDYQIKYFVEVKPKPKPKKVKPTPIKVIKVVKIATNYKLIKPELDENGNITHFNLHLIFSPQFITLLGDYFIKHKGYELNPIKVKKIQLNDINIHKFNRVTNFKVHHVIKLVKFLNENNIKCSYTVDAKNKLVYK